MARIASACREAFADLRIEIEREVAEGAYVVQYGCISGTNPGPLLGRPATGKPARFAYVDIPRLVDGQIVETWHVEDLAALLF